MREKYKSQLVKKGEGSAHSKAKDRLVNILMDLGWEVNPDAQLYVDWFLQSKYLSLLAGNPDPNKGYYHEFDIYAEKQGRHGITSQMFIEIDGKIHGSKPQQNRDKTAENYATFLLPNCTFKRIPISELLTDQDDKLIVDFYGLK